MAAGDDPSTVHLHNDELGIGALEEFVVENDASFRAEFNGVVVVSKDQSGGFDLFADLVNSVGDVAPVIKVWSLCATDRGERPPTSRSCIRGRWRGRTDELASFGLRSVRSGSVLTQQSFLVQRVPEVFAGLLK